MGQNSLITIDLAAIYNNVGILKSYLQQGTKLMAVVKADAYGHGAGVVAKRIADDVYGFAVNDIQEGIELRKNNIKNPILVFEPPAEETIVNYKEYNLCATVSDIQHFSILPAGVSYHLNFNTGMSRIGFRPEQAKRVASMVEEYTYLHCCGIYSHFPTADELSSSRSKEQLQLFNKIRIHFDPNLISHICNTAGIVRYGDEHFSMARAGMGIYGYAPGEITISGLIPALTWETHLVQVNKIKQGETVSYGATWRAPEDGYCGVIPVGYSDGIPRCLSGRFSVSIFGKNYPIVGAVTMNYCIVYLGKTKVKNGVEVSLFNKHCTAENWAEAAGSISYEILTGISPRIPRRYING